MANKTLRLLNKILLNVQLSEAERRYLLSERMLAVRRGQTVLTAAARAFIERHKDELK